MMSSPVRSRLLHASQSVRTFLQVRLTTSLSATVERPGAVIAAAAVCLGRVERVLGRGGARSRFGRVLADSAPAGRIEIVLRDGVVVRVDAHVDGRALRRVLGALVER